MTRVYLLALLFVNVFGAVSAQEYKFEHIGLEDGLPNNSVQRILQDKRGYLWAATSNGLARYDGYEFRVYKKRSQNVTSLPENIIMEMKEHSDGTLWIGTEARGCVLYDSEEDRFTPLTDLVKLDKAFAKSKVRRIQFDGDYIYVGTNLGLLLLEKKKGQLRFIKLFDLKGETITEIISLFPHQGKMFFANYASVFSYDIEKDSLRAYETHFTATSIALVNDSSFLIGMTKDSLALFNINSGELKKISHPLWDERMTVPVLYKDTEGTIWAGTQGHGIFKIRFVGEEFQVEQIKHSPDVPTSLSSNDIKFIFQDNNGTFWVATNGAGINKLQQNNQGFRQCQATADGIKLDPVRAFAAQNDSLVWVGTRNHGLLLFNQNTGEAKSVPLRINGQTVGRVVQGVSVDKNGIVWLGTEGEGLLRFKPDRNDLTQGKLVQYLGFNDTSNERLLSNAYVLKTLIDSKGRLWVGTWHGLNLLTPDQQHGRGQWNTTFRFFLHQESDSTSIAGNNIMTLFEDSRGEIWVGTRGGLSKVVEGADGKISFQNYTSNSADKNMLSDNVILHIFEDSKGRMYVATQNGGIHIFDRDKETFEYLDGQNGFTNLTIFSITESKDGTLWMGSGFGLIRLNQEKKFLRIYKKKDGVGNVEFRLGAGLKNGEVHFFGGSRGFTYFHEDSIRSRVSSPKVRLVSFKMNSKEVAVGAEINDRVLMPKAIGYTKEIELEYNENSINIGFSSLDLFGAEDVVYAYKLDGADEDWNVTAASFRMAIYPNLKAGDYLFRVKAIGSDGTWDTEETQLRIKVNPPFWLTWWFVTLCVLLILGVLWGIFRYRIYKLKEQQAILENKVEERTQQLKIANIELQEQNEEIRVQKEQIADQNESLEKSLKSTKLLSELGKKINSELDPNKLEQNIYTYITQLVAANAFGIARYNSIKERLEFHHYIEDGEVSPFSYRELSNEKSPTVTCFKNREVILKQEVDDEYLAYLNNMPEREGKEPPQSIILVPLVVEQRALGVMVVNSRKKKAYSQSDELNLMALSSYIAVALDNALAYRVLNSKNEAIGASIKYAQSIQKSIVPTRDFFERYFEYFVLLKPRDVVSGDFYWAQSVQDGEIERLFVAVVDCTGHGVPGAFMSLIGSRLLSEIVIQDNIYKADSILTELDNRIQRALHQDTTENMDGMDVCLCTFERKADGKIEKIQFSGAKRSLYVYRSLTKVVETIKGDRYYIGKSKMRKEKHFTTQDVPYQQGDVLFLSSDGFVDQNGSGRTKFGTKRLHELMEQVGQLSLKEQRDVFKSELETFMGNEEQRDDISLVGLKLLS